MDALLGLHVNEVCLTFWECVVGASRQADLASPRFD